LPHLYLYQGDNGNIILGKKIPNNNPYAEFDYESYGIFNKNGKQLVPYGIYYSACKLPEGVALNPPKRTLKDNVIIFKPNGKIEKQDYYYIERKAKSEGQEFFLTHYWDGDWYTNLLVKENQHKEI